MSANRWRNLRSYGVPADEQQFRALCEQRDWLAKGSKGMLRWRKRLFVWMSRNARPATAYFALPANRVVELGAQLEL